jgi:hypothetical protein
MHKEEEAFVEFATEIQDLVVYVERTWVGLCGSSTSGR